MGIELQDSINSSSTPVIKAQRIGEVARVALVHWEQRHVMKDGEVVINARTGKPKHELVIHGIALPGTTSVAGLGERVEQPQPGSPCRFIFRGGAFAQWLEARKGHRDGKLCVGDVVGRVVEYAQAYTDKGQPKGDRMTDQSQVDALPRNTSVGFYGPISLSRPTDEAWVQKAEAAYREWQDSQRQLPDEVDEFA